MEADSEESPLLPYHLHRSRVRRFSQTILGILVIFSIIFCASFLTTLETAIEVNHRLWNGLPLKAVPKHLKSFQDCSIRRFVKDTQLKFLGTAHPLLISEFVDRRDRLAQALVNEGLDAFAVEPGYTLQYYANVGQSDWGSSERPFMMVLQPREVNGTIKAQTSFLIPSFEAGRAALLDIPFEEPIDFITYEEHWNYYSTLRNAAIFEGFMTTDPRVMVDEEMRDFISRGLDENGFDVVGLGGDVEAVRQIKSEGEIGIMRAVNTGTVEALRGMRKCLKPGLTENDVRLVLDNTMRAGGLDPSFTLVLFDEDASNPHGGTDGKKTLTNETMVLIDVGAQLYGYSSDVTRSFFPPFLARHPLEDDMAAIKDSLKEKLRVWGIVFDAQTASMEMMHEGSTAAAVDLAARKIIDGHGYGYAFTHRLGHGIGLRGHESPYLNKGNVYTTLKAGMTVTSEPGIYLEDEFGIRHEDVVMVREEDRFPDVLSGQRAVDPWNP